jgi:hypothetical protein
MAHVFVSKPMGLLFLIDEKENADPPTAVGWA